MTAWRTARGSCKAVFAWRSSRQRPSRSSRGSFRSCRRIPWRLRRSSPPAGIAGPPPDRGSVARESVGHHGLLPKSGVASPVAASPQSTDTDPEVQPPVFVCLFVCLLAFRFRKRIEELTLEFSEVTRKLEISEKEKRQLQKTLAEQDVKLNEQLDRINHIQHQVRRASRWPAQALALFKTKCVALGNFPAVQWLRLPSLTAEGLGLIPGRKLKIPQAQRQGQKKLHCSLFGKMLPPIHCKLLVQNLC